MPIKTRRLAAVTGLAATAVATAAVLTAGQPSPAAAAGTRPAAVGCTGSWRLVIAEPPGSLPALVQVGADHTVIYGETAAIDSLTPGVPVEYTSPGIGVWTGRGNACAYRIIVNAANAHGQYTRTSDITGTLTVTDGGQRFAGPLTIAVTHPDGTRFVIRTTATATRISPP
jgi:hypothetical protein